MAALAIGDHLHLVIGILHEVSVSAYQLWTPVLDPSAPFLADPVGGAIGLVSGTYPAVRAARMKPAEAARTGCGDILGK